MTQNTKKKTIIEFHTQKQKTISYENEQLPPSWVSTERKLQRIEEDKPRSIQESRIIQTERNGVLRGKITQLIDSAKETICVSSFLIADAHIIPSLLSASERGVRVYLLTASETQLFKDPTHDSEYELRRMHEHIQTLEKMAGHLLVRIGNNLHSKFVLIDPNTPNPRGYLLTANITSEALTRNVELGINLYPREVKDIFKQFIIGFWKESHSELLEPGRISKNKLWNPGKINEPQDTLFTIDSKSTIKQKIKDLLKLAKNEIIVSTYGIDLSHEITQNLLELLESGKKVKFLARPRQNKKTMDALLALVKAGAEVRGHPWLHAKSILVNTNEGWTGIVMTANIEQHGLDDGFETGVLLIKEDAKKLHQMLENWWDNFPQKLLAQPRLGDLLGEITQWTNNTFKTLSIKPEYVENLGTFTVNSFNELETKEPQLTSKKINSSTKYHRIKYSWTNLPPKLPSKAKKGIPVEGLDIYKNGKNTYIVIQNKSQLEKGNKISTEMKAKLVSR